MNDEGLDTGLKIALADNEFLPQFLALLVIIARITGFRASQPRLAFVGVVDAFIDRQTLCDQVYIFKSSQWRYFFRGPEGY